MVLVLVFTVVIAVPIALLLWRRTPGGQQDPQANRDTGRLAGPQYGFGSQHGDGGMSQ